MQAHRLVALAALVLGVLPGDALLLADLPQRDAGTLRGSPSVDHLPRSLAVAPSGADGQAPTGRSRRAMTATPTAIAIHEVPALVVADPDGDEQQEPARATAG